MCASRYSDISPGLNSSCGFLDVCCPVFQDNTVVRLFREAGAIIVGTTAMTEFGVTPLGYLDLPIMLRFRQAFSGRFG